MSMTQNEYNIMKKAMDMLREFEGFGQFAEMSDVISRL